MLISKLLSRHCCSCKLKYHVFQVALVRQMGFGHPRARATFIGLSKLSPSSSGQVTSEKVSQEGFKHICALHSMVSAEPHLLSAMSEPGPRGRWHLRSPAWLLNLKPWAASQNCLQVCQRFNFLLHTRSGLKNKDWRLNLRSSTHEAWLRTLWTSTLPSTAFASYFW